MKTLSRIDTLTDFTWRDRKGRFHAPQQMETRHIYYTLRMLWNHSAPEHLKLKPYHKYSFPPYYTSEYCARAVGHLLKELSTRDIPIEYANDINFMLDVSKRERERIDEIEGKGE